MKVHLIKAKTVMDFARNQSLPVNTFDTWIDRINEADWESPNDIKRTFASADILGNGSDRVVFNVGGNNHRIICTYRFGKSRIRLYVNWMGTHADYDKICSKGDQYTIAEF